MSKPDKNYDDEFKRDAIALYRTSTLPKAQIARELGVSLGSLREWDKRDRQANGGSAGTAAPAGAAGAGADPVRLAEEVRRLTKENEHLRRQQEILKKAAVILGTNPHTRDSR